MSLVKRLDDLKFEVAGFLNRDPKWCWSRLVDWVVFHKWSELLRQPDYYLADGCEYCLKCVYVKQRKDSYAQEADRVQRRGDRLLKARV